MDHINGTKDRRIVKFINALMVKADVPGLAIAVVSQGAIDSRHEFGLKRSGGTEPIDEGTVFEAASMSKPVFAYGVLKLVDAGKLDLDVPLSTYLPDYDVQDGQGRIKKITARIVLSHMTGFPNWRPDNHPLRIYFEPGSRFSYSGEGYVYLQRAVERITGKPLAEYMKEAVLDPLGMRSSSYVWEERYQKLKAYGHNPAVEPSIGVKWTEGQSAGSLAVTVSDYARFIIALLKGRGLKSATFAEMLTLRVHVPENCVDCTAENPGALSPTVAWGLGVGLQQTPAGEAFWHWGDNRNEYQCFMLGFPKRDSGVVILTNSGNGLSTMRQIVQKLTGLDLPLFDWLKPEPYDSPAKLLFRAITEEGPTALGKYVARRQDLHADKVIGEMPMNLIGYWLLRKGKVQAAIEVFKLNVRDYPCLSNAYDSLGEGYMIAGEKELAISNYQHSLELDPTNANAGAKLKVLNAR